MGVIEDYLRSRTLLYDTEDGLNRRKITASTAQESILGLDLWNVAYNGLLKMETLERTRLVEYTDDVPVPVTARNVELFQYKINHIIRRVRRWMSTC